MEDETDLIRCRSCFHLWDTHGDRGCTLVHLDGYRCKCLLIRNVREIVDNKEALCVGCGHSASKHGLHHCLAWYDNDTPCNCETFAKLVKPESDNCKTCIHPMRMHISSGCYQSVPSDLYLDESCGCTVPGLQTDDVLNGRESVNSYRERVGKMEEAPDNVNHPSHYNQYKGVEVIDLTEQMNFNRGNAVKYICRAGFKDPEKELEDLEKAKWYLDREINRIKEEKHGKHLEGVLTSDEIMLLKEHPYASINKKTGEVQIPGKGIFKNSFLARDYMRRLEET